MKTCTKCKETKPLSEFHNCKSKPGGKFSACKVCRNAASRERAERIGYDEIYRRAKSSPGYKEKQAKRYQAKREEYLAKNKLWREQNPGVKKKARKADYDKNRERYIEEAVRWAKENPERRKEITSEYSKRQRLDPSKRPILTARALLARVIKATGKKKRGKTFDLLGYNSHEFCAHIEKQFLPGMTWANHGEWHVDHIVSVSEMLSLGITCPRKINALSNLRPMWAKDNLSKGAGFDLVAQVAK